MIPTAEEFFYQKSGGEIVMTEDEAQNYAIEFAKLHVKAALEAGSETKFPSSAGNSLVEHTPNAKQSILNAYPENLIK